MLSTTTGYLMTGTRMFSLGLVDSIELWHTAESVLLVMDDRKIVLDEGESRIVRRWVELEMQTSIADAEGGLIETRCDRQEQIVRANKMNRAATKRESRRRHAAVVDLETWKRVNRHEPTAVGDPCGVPAA